MEEFLGNHQLKIKFEKKLHFLPNCHTLYFKPNFKITHYNNSHLNYIYVYQTDKIDYTFYGFFKNDTFCIIYNSYNKKIDVSIEHKGLFVIKINWILQPIHSTLDIWIVDTQLFHNLTVECYILPLGKKIFSENIHIDNLLKIYNYQLYYAKIYKSFDKNSIIQNILFKFIL
jgi:hypothetical protein